MNSSLITLFTFLLVIFASSAAVCSAEVTFTDTSGTQITLPSPAERVVCLNSDVAEAMVALGAGDKVVGVTDSIMTDSALVSHLPNTVSVGDWQTPSVEKVLQLKPDAVITYSSSKPKNVDQFTSAGISLIYLDCYKITSLEHDITSLGIMIGAGERADQYINFMKKWDEIVRSRVSNISEEKIPSVYVEGYTDYSAQGKGSGIDLMMGIARGKNLAADLGEQWPKVTPEWVIKENPSIIIKSASLKPDKTLEDIRTSVSERSGFDTLSAVKNNQVFVINGDLTYGPRSPAGLVYLAKALHPNEFTDISPGEVLKEYATGFVSGMENGDYFSPFL